jgi:hypothetical protein
MADDDLRKTLNRRLFDLAKKLAPTDPVLKAMVERKEPIRPKTLLLDPRTDDLTVDHLGNIAAVSGDYARAQDGASELTELMAAHGLWELPSEVETPDEPGASAEIIEKPTAGRPPSGRVEVRQTARKLGRLREAMPWKDYIKELRDAAGVANGDAWFDKSTIMRALNGWDLSKPDDAEL